MQFCEKCGKPLTICVENGKVIGRCACGFVKNEPDVSFSEKSENIERGKGVAKTKKWGGIFPNKCKKCGHEGAEVIYSGTFVGDEAEVGLYKCGKCGHIERKSGGTCKP